MGVAPLTDDRDFVFSGHWNSKKNPLRVDGLSNCQRSNPYICSLLNMTCSQLMCQSEVIDPVRDWQTEPDSKSPESAVFGRLNLYTSTIRALLILMNVDLLAGKRRGIASFAKSYLNS